MNLPAGTFIAVSAVFLMAVWDVFSRFAIDGLQANPAVYACLTLLFASMTLIIAAGPGRLGVATLRSLHTWVYAIAQIAMAVSEAYSYTVVTATEFNFITRIQIILTILLAYIIFGRKPSKHDFIGIAIILIGVGIMITTLPLQSRFYAIIFIGLSSLFFAIRTALAESHPTSNSAQTIREQCRVTGFVVFVTSFVFIIFYTILGLLVDNTPALEGLPFLPSATSFISPQTILSAAFCGIFIVAAAKYLYFVATRTIKGENYTIIASLAGVFAFVFEKVGSYFTPYINASTLDFYDVIAAFILTFGAIYMAFMRRKSAH